MMRHVYKINYLPNNNTIIDLLTILEQNKLFTSLSAYFVGLYQPWALRGPIQPDLARGISKVREGKKLSSKNTFKSLSMVSMAFFHGQGHIEAELIGMFQENLVLISGFRKTIFLIDRTKNFRVGVYDHMWSNINTITDKSSQTQT